MKKYRDCKNHNLYSGGHKNRGGDDNTLQSHHRQGSDGIPLKETWTKINYLSEWLIGYQFLIY